MWYNIILAAGFVLLILATISFRKSLTFIRASKRALAIVVKLTETKDSEGDLLYSPVFSFHTHNGYECRLDTGWASSPPMWQVGQTTTILYDPNDPTRAELLTYFGMFRWTIIYAAIAAPLLVVGIGYHIAGLVL